MIYRFSNCEIDTQLYELRVDGEPVPIQPLVFNLLQFLVENRERVVTKDELYDHIWPGRVVSEATLSSGIKAAREAIGDSGRDQHSIRTIHGRGFHFIEDITIQKTEEGTEQIDKKEKVNDEAQASNDIPYPSIVVLPFINMSADPEQEHFADGITEDIIALLSRFRLLSVTSRNSAFSYKGQSTDARTIAKELGVRYILEGSIRRAGNSLRVSVQFIEAASGNSIWSERFDRDVKDIFDVQDEIATAVAGATISELSHAERERAHRKAPQNLNAWEWYQRGLREMYRFEPEGFLEAKKLFRCALRHDPELTLAHTALAYALLQEVMYSDPGDPSQLVDEAFKCARKGIALDDRNAFGHYVLGRVEILRHELDTACLEFKKAIDLNPSFAYSYFGLGIALLDMSKYELALSQFKTAQALSPRDPHGWTFIHYQAWPLLALERYEQVVEIERTALRSPNAGFWPYLPLIAALGYLGRKDEAKRELANLEKIQPNYSCASARRYLKTAVNPIIDQVIEGLRRAGLPS